jgi:capsular polysaccharide transport system permease protein
MTTKPKAKKFRIRRSGSLAVAQAAVNEDINDSGEAVVTASTPMPASAGPARPTATMPQGDIDSPATVAAETDIDTIRQEGLTGRQLRLARRVAQKHGLAVTSDFDAVRQLRASGIDPFQRSSILELVIPDTDAVGAGPGANLPQNQAAIGRIQLPQTMPQKGKNLPSTERANPAERRAGEIIQIQRDIAKRRKRKLFLLATRLAFFVLLPTFLAGWYFYVVASPMYATKSEFVIQKAEASGAAAGLAGMFSGTSIANQGDSIVVQSYLTSRAAMVRLDEDHNFKQHFSQSWIDPIQRLPAGASNEEAFKLYSNRVKISYDPTEGILKMEVVAADPATSQLFSEALIKYAEEQVDQLTQRLRGDQMAGAQASYDAAEKRRAEALQHLLDVQNEVAVIDPISESAAILQQITTLESRRQQKTLELISLQNARRPNDARVNGVKSEIEGLETLIADLRGQMTQSGGGGSTLATKTTELRIAEEDYQFQTVMVQQALSMMEVARTEANRQVRYLSLGVEPVAPDDPTYPRAFESTMLTLLIFSGLYLMISLTVSILREQVSS